jgi:hypothetical protein
MILKANRSFLILAGLFIYLMNPAHAQVKPVPQTFQDFVINLQKPGTAGQGTIVIRQDPRLVEQVIAMNETNFAIKSIPGYRIRIFSAAGRDAKQKMTTEYTRFVKNFENITPYIEYDPPYWKIYVGDFINRSEAEKAKQQVIGQFPVAFVRVARIKVPDVNKMDKHK